MLLRERCWQCKILLGAKFPQMVVMKYSTVFPHNHTIFRIRSANMTYQKSLYFQSNIHQNILIDRRLSLLHSHGVGGADIYSNNKMKFLICWYTHLWMCVLNQYTSCRCSTFTHFCRNYIYIPPPKSNYFSLIKMWLNLIHLENFHTFFEAKFLVHFLKQNF